MVVHGFLIRPKEKDIIPAIVDTEIDRGIHRLIECGDSPLTVIHIGHRNFIYVDDEGLLKDQQYYFQIDDGLPIAGRGLVLAEAIDGEYASTSMTIEELNERISFSRRKMIGFEVVEGVTDVLGKPGWGIQSTPIFGPVEPEGK